jgi:Flp pilus assembly protein TadB
LKGPCAAKGTPEGGGEYKSQVLASAGAGAAAAEPDDTSFKIAYATICPEELRKKRHITKKRKVKEGKGPKKTKSRRKETKKEKRERERERKRERSIHLRKFGFVCFSSYYFGCVFVCLLACLIVSFFLFCLLLLLQEFHQPNHTVTQSRKTHLSFFSFFFPPTLSLPSFPKNEKIWSCHLFLQTWVT